MLIEKFSARRSAGGKNTVDIRAVKKEGGNTILTIDAGKIVGAYPGGAVAIYKSAGDTERFAVGEIIEPTDDFKATVKVLEKDIPENARVILATPFFGSNKRLVALDLTPGKNTAEKDDAGLQMIKRLSQKLEKNDYVTAKTVANPLAENKKDWNLAIVRSIYGEFKKGNRQPATKDSAAVPKETDEVYYLANTNGNPLYNFYVKADNPKAEDEIQTALEKFVRVDNLRTLGNETSDLSKGLEMKIIKLKALKDPPQSINDIVEDGILEKPLLTVGDFFSFEITNKTGNPLFVYLYSIGTDGAVKLIYEPKTDGDKLENNVSMKTLASKTIARAAPPYGVETFKLIAATQRFNGNLLTSPAIAGTRSKGGNPFEALLAQASTNTRNAEIVTFEFSGWSASGMDVEIREK